MSMNDVIQDALDDLASSRSSTSRKGRALNTLEKLLAGICVPTDPSASEKLKRFITLQDTFQCNVPSRLITWVSESSNRLEILISRGTLDEKKEAEVSTLSTQVVQALSIIQGVALSHSASKRYLGRKYPLEVLVDLLLTSRHVGTPPNDDTPKSPKYENPKIHLNRGVPSVPLASAVLDTLLCIMVDSSLSLRAFEDVNGVQSVVKILKRAGTPREVRMKCLEFLYFYLMDENSSSPPSIDLSNPGLVSPTSPRSPTRPKHRPTFSLSTMSQFSDSSTVSSHSASSSVSSTTSYSVISSSTSVSSRQSSVEPESTPNTLGIPELKPPPRVITPPQPLDMSMLRRDLDFVPITPKKAQISRLGVGAPTRTVSHETPLRRPAEVLSAEDTEPEDTFAFKRDDMRTPRKAQPRGLQRLNVSSLGDVASKSTSNQSVHRRARSSADVVRSPPTSPPPLPQRRDIRSLRPEVRSMEEKKELLGGMLGNVDALVEGVRKAGIWGLG